MQCRACDAALVPVVDLGSQPVGGLFPLPEDPPDALLPLRLAICEGCGLAQLADHSPPEASSQDLPSPLSSATMASHAATFVDDLIGRGLVSPSSRVLSLASHGGHLAPFLHQRGMAVTVFDADVWPAARLWGGRGRVVAGRIDDPALAPDPGGPFDLVVDAYLLAHLDHPRLALVRLAALLAPGGTLVLEFDHLLATVEGCQWDAVRHGHQTYVALGWLARELAGVGLAILDAVPQRVYGGALRVFARANASTCTTALEVIAREGVARIDRPQGLEPLGAAVERARVEVVRHLAAARAAGRRVIGYGAPARSITFLNALGIGPNLLPFVVDRAPAKQGRSLPGVRIPIRSPDALTDEVPDEVLILTWDLVAEVRAKLATLVPAATRFLIAVPGITDVTADDCGSGRPPASAVVL